LQKVDILKWGIKEGKEGEIKKGQKRVGERKDEEK